MDLQDLEKGIIIQRKSQLHRIPLNMPEVYFHMHDIPIENNSTFFVNIYKDAEQQLFRFRSTCDFFNFIEDNVTCRLFLQTLCGNVLEWYNSLLFGTITCWDVLETSFSETFIPRVKSYVFVDDFNVVSHPPSPIWTQYNEVNL
jgi:hypothetical protein